MVKGLEIKPYEKPLKEPIMFSLQGEKTKGTYNSNFKYLGVTQKENI